MNQWETKELERLFHQFRMNHPHFRNIEYTSLYDAVYVTYSDYRGPVQRLAGRNSDLVKLQDYQFNGHLLEVLKDVAYLERKETMTYQNEEERQAQARKKGEKWGRWLLAIQPAIPGDVLREISMELAKLYGYGNIDEAMEFGAGIWDKFQTYREANVKQIEQ